MELVRLHQRVFGKLGAGGELMEAPVDSAESSLSNLTGSPLLQRLLSVFETHTLGKEENSHIYERLPLREAALCPHDFQHPPKKPRG